MTTKCGQTRLVDELIRKLNNKSYGSSGYGGGHECCKCGCDGGDDNLPAILGAIAAAALFLQMAITMAAAKKRRKRSELTDDDEDLNGLLSHSVDIIMSSKSLV